MTSETAIPLLFFSLFANGVALIVVHQVLPRKKIVHRHREEFLQYMRELNAEEAGRELLEEFQSVKQLKQANECLKRALCK